MPYSNSVPVAELDQHGLIYDRPAPSLPMNAFSDGLNVRFRDGSIRKMQGELNIFPHLFDDATNLIGGTPANYDGSSIKYIAFWANPNIIGGNQGYYLVITEETRDTAQVDVAYLVSVDGEDKVEKGVFTAANEGTWHHTLFQGGFALIINNNIDKPHYILDDDGNADINAVPNFLELPGWDSYYLENISLTDRFDPPIPDEDGNIIGDTYIFSLGKKIDFDEFYVKVYRENSTAPGTYVNLSPTGDTGVDGTPNNVGFIPSDLLTIGQTPHTVDDKYEIYYDFASGVTVLNLPSNLSVDGRDTITVKVISRNPVTVTAGVIRSFGDFLVAGDLVERSKEAPYDILRSLPGVVRTSDVAPPGAIPNNWNPYSTGVSTADEYIVSDVAPVTDMSEMQGNLYIYTTNSISVLRRTGNPNQPVSISTLTDSYGCQNINSVLEFEGKHIVVGSKDIYLFAGNPSGIESIADGRVRRYFTSTLNPIAARRTFLLDNKAREEIWICYPTTVSTTGSCDEALIWSYTNNTWSRRELRGVVSGTIGPIPGGGLPGASLSFSGDSGDAGVTDVGSYEVRMIGLDSTDEWLGTTDLTYTTGTANMYVNGTTADFYTSVVTQPSITITGPEDISETISLDYGSDFKITAQEAWDQIETALESVSGWSFSTLPTDYVQKSGSVKLYAADTLRLVEGEPFTITVNDVGSFPTISTIDFQDSLVDSPVHGEVVDITTDYRGSEVLRASPTVIGIELFVPDATGEREFLFLVIGGEGDYDPATHTGTNNGVLYSDADTASQVISKLQSKTSLFIVNEGATENDVTISSAAYNVAAGTIYDLRINTTAEDTEWILNNYTACLSGTYDLNPNTDVIDTDNFDIASNSPAIAGTLDVQHTPDVSRTPDRTDTSPAATLMLTAEVNNNFDLLRPWPIDEVNPTLEYPILASKNFLDDVTDRPLVNKILAADLGWSIPKFSQTPRVETVAPEGPFIQITENDEPLAYNSYVERKQLNISPDQDTETVHQITLWATGDYVPYVGAEPLHNRLQIRYKGTDNPSQDSDLTTLTGNKKGDFFISEANKVDTRLNGRYLNLRLTDEILGTDDVILEATSNYKRSTNTLFSQQALWEVSGLQPEVNKGGRR